MTDDLRIDEVEKEVKKLKVDVENFMELKNTVSDLRNTVTGIRALISETQNPFNLLQFITDEDELNKLIQARPLLEKKFLAKARAEGKVEGKGAAAEAGMIGKRVGFVVESNVESASAAEASENSVEEVEEKGGEVQTGNHMEGEEGRKEISTRTGDATIGDVSKGISVIRWIYKMLDLGFDERSIRKICDYCEFFCYMPRGYSEQVSNLVGAIISARFQKISAEEFMLSILGVADAVGVKINSDDLSGLVIRVLEKNKASECV